MLTKAVVRSIPDSYETFYRKQGIHIDLALAHRQHELYVAALKWLGLGVDVLPADERFPDCVFIEDTAVFHDGQVLITRPGSEYRRGEVGAVREYFHGKHRLREMSLDAFLEGGDVLKTDRAAYVGISKVTNSPGADELHQLFRDRRVTSVPVTRTLHLKSACSYVGDNHLLLCSELLPQHPFSAYRILSVPTAESNASNCVAVGRKVLLPTENEKTTAIVRQAGFDVRTVPITEFVKGEGSLTCLSILY